jgi:hypothetical protein
MRRSPLLPAFFASLLLAVLAVPRASAYNYYTVIVGGLFDQGETAPRSLGPIAFSGGVGSTGSGSGKVELGRLTAFDGCSNPISGLFTPQIDVRTQVSLDAYEITCPTCPESPDTPTPVVLHMTLTGTLKNSGANPYSAHLGLTVSTVTDLLQGELRVDALGVHSAGILSGAPTTLDHYALDLPLSMYLGSTGADILSFTLESTAGGTASGTEVNTATADFSGSGWQLGPGDVFTGLPVGATVNIPGMHVVNNRWLGPSATDAVTPPGAIAVLALSPLRTPVRGEARLLLSLPAAGLARVDVFDVTGARVATPLEGWREAGRHALAWSTSGAGPGVYFARVQFAGRSATTRFVVLP